MIYDYKSDKIVQDVVLDSICELLKDIEDEYKILHRDEYLFVYAPSYIVKKIITKLLADMDTFVHEESYTDLLDEDDNDVLLTIANDGMLFVENARKENNQLKSPNGCSLAYVYDEFSNKDVDLLSFEGESVLVFGFNESVLDKEDGYKINGVNVSKEVFDNYVNKSIKCVHNEDTDNSKVEFPNTDTELEESNNNSKTTYKVNGEEVSKEDYEKALEKFNNKYMNNIQDMLLNHMEFVNEIYNFARLFNW